MEKQRKHVAKGAENTYLSMLVVISAFFVYVRAPEAKSEMCPEEDDSHCVRTNKPTGEPRYEAFLVA